jgi:small subunit ribosomal protein S8
MRIDTISDMLTRIRNANLADHNIVVIPSTKIVRDIAQVLADEGLIERFKNVENGLLSVILIVLKYDCDVVGVTRTPRIQRLRRISKPGRRVYSRAHKLPRVLGGYGIAIISTCRGLMTDKRAREERIGGEILCFIW